MTDNPLDQQTLSVECLDSSVLQVDMVSLVEGVGEGNII